MTRPARRLAGWLAASLALIGGAPADGFPVTIRDATGTAVVIPTAPRRIVSLAPSVTEILFALGLDREVVGVSDADDYPPDKVRARARIGGVIISVEGVIALRPDLVIGMPSLQHDQLARLRALRLPVLAVDAASVDETISQIRLLGRATGRLDRAAALAEALEGRARQVRPAARRTVYIEAWSEPILAVGRGTLADDMVRRAGGINILGDRQGYAQVPAEVVLARNPQVVLMLYPGKERLRTRPGWRAMDAVRADRVYELPTSLVSRPGPRVADGLALVARLLQAGP
ncbi:MAG: helical backbone metal receptor [Armatimonadota bacterium]|nr:helical backbone metal receptor [Armatimonadota bacterium]MDR7520168.1 helical backbone metal receptor [Armatimonadota bacterium]MDR7549243.1 helical backbone metal receptor [Armatimonadota bacterium]